MSMSTLPERLLVTSSRTPMRVHVSTGNGGGNVKKVENAPLKKLYWKNSSFRVVPFRRKPTSHACLSGSSGERWTRTKRSSVWVAVLAFSRRNSASTQRSLAALGKRRAT